MRSASSSSASVAGRSCPGDAGERRLDVRLAEPARLSRIDLPAGTAARLFSTSPPCVSRCTRRQGLDRPPVVGVEVAAGDAGGRPGIVDLSQRPGLEGGDELDLVDHAVLKREQSEERWRSAAAAMGKLRATTSSPARPTTAREPGREGSVATGALSHERDGPCITATLRPLLMNRCAFARGGCMF